MKKIIILIISLFLVTGCSVKYNVSINDDLSILEEAKITGTDSFFNNFYKTTRKHVLEDFIEIYKDVLEEKEYQYKLNDEDSKNPYVLVNKKYDSIKDYLDKSLMFNDYFDEIKYTENGSIKKIETIGYHENDIDDPGRFNVQELEITITCPFKVKNHNAKNVDEKTNTYHYELSEASGYKILLEFDANRKFNPNEKMITTIIICFSVIALSWIIICVLNKRKK